MLRRVFGGGETLLSMSAPAALWKRSRWRLMGFASDPCGNIIFRRSFKGDGLFGWDVIEASSGVSHAVHWQAAVAFRKDTTMALRDPSLRTGYRALWLKAAFGSVACLASVIAFGEYNRFKWWLNPPAREGLARLEGQVTAMPRRALSDLGPVYDTYVAAAATIGYPERVHPQVVEIPMPPPQTSKTGSGWSLTTVLLACTTAVTLWIL